MVKEANKAALNSLGKWAALHHAGALADGNKLIRSLRVGVIGGGLRFGGEMISTEPGGYDPIFSRTACFRRMRACDDTPRSSATRQTRLSSNSCTLPSVKTSSHIIATIRSSSGSSSRRFNTLVKPKR